MGNPYNFNNPTSASDFVGRWDLVDGLARDFYDPRGSSHAIIAGKRCGKTSLLLVLQDRLIDRLRQRESDGWCVLPVFLDVMGVKDEAPFFVYKGLVDELRLLTLPDDAAFGSAPLLPLDLDVALIETYYGNYSALTGVDEFKKVLAHLVARARQQYGLLRFVFLLDEVEEIAEKMWANELFGQLRSLTTNPRTSQHIRYVMAGSQRFLRAQRRPGSPLLNMFTRHPLGPLPEDALELLIDKGGGFPVDVAEEVLLLSRGHPYIAQFLLHYLWETGPSPAHDDVEAASRILLTQNADILHGWCEALGTSGRAVLQIMAATDEGLTVQTIRSLLSDTDIEVDEALYAIGYHNLAVAEGRPPHYRCGSELFRRWFLEHYPGSPAATPVTKPDAMRDDVQVNERKEGLSLEINDNRANTAESIPYDLVSAIAQGDAVLLVGAGLSCDAGLLSWSELLTPLADRMALPPQRRGDLLQVAQDYENASGRRALLDHVLTHTETVGKGPTENHHRLLRLPVRTWITTNYDDLLERTLQEANQAYAKVVQEQNLSYVRGDQVAVYKLHGDRQQSGTIIITRRDYNTYFKRFPLVKAKLTALLAEKTFLFLGYSISDPDFNQLRDEIALDLEEHQRRAYAVLFDADPFAVTDLRQRQVEVLNLPLTPGESLSGRLAQFLEELIKRVGGFSATGTGVVPGPARSGSPPPTSGPGPASVSPAPASSFAEVKRRHSLQRRLAQSQEEYQAVSRQLEVEVSSAIRVRLKEQLTDIEQEIGRLEVELTSL